MVSVGGGSAGAMSRGGGGTRVLVRAGGVERGGRGRRCRRRGEVESGEGERSEGFLCFFDDALTERGEEVEQVVVVEAGGTGRVEHGRGVVFVVLEMEIQQFEVRRGVEARRGIRGVLVSGEGHCCCLTGGLAEWGDNRTMDEGKPC